MNTVCHPIGDNRGIATITKTTNADGPYLIFNVATGDFSEDFANDIERHGYKTRKEYSKLIGYIKHANTESKWTKR